MRLNNKEFIRNYLNIQYINTDDYHVVEYEYRL